MRRERKTNTFRTLAMFTSECIGFRSRDKDRGQCQKATSAAVL
jgi:hypothetical protein